jgi:hypothetical protein
VTSRPARRRDLAALRVSYAVRRRLILSHLEHASGRLDLRHNAPPGYEGARKGCIREVEGIIQHTARPGWRRPGRQSREPDQAANNSAPLRSYFRDSGPAIVPNGWGPTHPAL